MATQPGRNGTQSNGKVLTKSMAVRSIYGGVISAADTSTNRPNVSYRNLGFLVYSMRVISTDTSIVRIATTRRGSARWLFFKKFQYDEF
jgi:hypothetical protein